MECIIIFQQSHHVYKALYFLLTLIGCLYGVSLVEAAALQPGASAQSADTVSSGKWMIRLLSYADKNRAAGFIHRLKKKGFIAEMVEVGMNGHIRYQVRINGLSNQDEAMQYRARLKSTTNIADHHIQVIVPPHPSTPISSALSSDIPAQAILQQDTNVTPVTDSAQEGVSNFQTFSEPILPDWHFYGSNTFRMDGFNASGDRASSPYQFTGIQSYDELNLNFDRAFSPYNRVTGQINGLIANDSKYRSSFFGTVPERLHIKQENGGLSIPYRAEIGDVYTYTSFRTMQRSLKGLQVEFQPDFGGDFRHSVMLFSGGGSTSWRSFQLEDDWSNGASWLAEHPVYGKISANLVFNHKKANQAAGLQSNQQYVYSLAYGKKGEWSTVRWPWLAQQLSLEGEVGRFVGDHVDVNGAGTGQNRQGNGYFVQVTGSPVSLPALGYRARFEAYDQDYQPNGAAIQSDRRSEEGHLSWRFASGLTARARLQNFHTAWKTTNPVDTIIYGSNFSGPVPGIKGMSGSVDAFEQSVESLDLTTNNVNKSLNMNVNQAISRLLSARAGLFYSNTRDRTNATTGVSITRQYSAGLDYRFEQFGFTGTVSPGMMIRTVNTQGSKANRDYNPTLNLDARRGPHSVSLSYSALDQGRPSNDLGVVTRTAGLNYRYTDKRGIIGVEANWYERDPDKVATARTDAWRLGAFLTINFDKPVRSHSVENQADMVEFTSPELQDADTAARMTVGITDLIPGMGEAAVRKMMVARGLGAPTEQAGLLIWFSRIFRDMDQTQRLAVDVADGFVSRAAIIVEFDDVGNSADAQRTFTRLRQQLVEEYGNPDTFFEQGDFGANLGVDLAANRFIRVMEWKRDGGILRFGIPRRLDGRIRMEVQFARHFRALKDTLWSLEQVQ